MKEMNMSYQAWEVSSTLLLSSPAHITCIALPLLLITCWAVA